MIRQKPDSDLIFLGRYESEHDEIDAQMLLLPANGDLADIGVNLSLDPELKLCLETGQEEFAVTSATLLAVPTNSYYIESPATDFQQESM